MADSFQSYKVTSNEQSSATKFNNLVQALEDAINSLDNSNIDAAAAIAVSKFAAGSNGDVLTTSAGIPVWSPAAGAPTYQTTLPGAPTNGQETILVDSTSTPTYAWRLRYNSTLAKWEYIGGRPAYVEVATAEATSSATYTALATAGPSIALPVAGDYIVELQFSGTNAASGSGAMSYDIGGTGAVDADWVPLGTNNPVFVPMVYSFKQKTGLTAVTLTAKYRTNGVSMTFSNRRMRVTPVKLG